MLSKITTTIAIFLIFGSMPVSAQSNFEIKTLLPIDSIGTQAISPADDDIVLDFPLSICLDSQENVYILDCGNHRIVKLNKKLEKVAEIGREGQGPREFSFTKGMLNTGVMRNDADDNLYIYDKNQRIQVISSEFELLKTFRIRFISDIGVGLAQRLYTLHLNREKNTLIDLYDKDNKLISSFCKTYITHPGPSSKNMILNSSHFAVNISGEILIANEFNPIIRLFDKDGNLKWEKFLDLQKIFGKDDINLYQPNDPIDQFNNKVYDFRKFTERKLILSIKSDGINFYILFSFKNYLVELDSSGDVRSVQKLFVPGGTDRWSGTIDFDIENKRLFLLLLDDQMVLLYNI